MNLVTMVLFAFFLGVASIIAMGAYLLQDDEMKPLKKSRREKK